MSIDRNEWRRCGPSIQWNITHKKSEIWPFAAMWTDLKMVILSEVSQTEEDNDHDAICRWSLISNGYERTYLKNRNKPQISRSVKTTITTQFVGGV